MHSTHSAVPVPSLKEQLVRESCSMVRRLVTNGARVPPSLIQAADGFEVALERGKPIDITVLAGTHERLARLVAPAKPGTLYLLDYSTHQRGKDPSSLGPVKLVRELVRVAMVCVAVFIILSVVALVDAHPSIDLFKSDGATAAPGGKVDHHGLLVIKIILERVFWLAAAGIGAAFAMLFALNDQITARTFDPDETPSYWVKFFLGLVAGFILVALVPIGSGSGGQDATTSTQALGPPTVALLGGFSASAVYRILTRMVEALESVFTGGAKEQAAAAEKSAASRASEESSQARMAVAGQLVDLQQQLAAGMPADRAATQLRQVVAALVPASSEFAGGLQGDSPAGAPSAATPPDKVPALAVVGDGGGSAAADGGASADPSTTDASVAPDASAVDVSASADACAKDGAAPAAAAVG